MATINVENEKHASMQVEFADEKKLEQSTQGDYSGAVAKTDKAEIALVKKLDRRIMPALFVMYFLYVGSINDYVAVTNHLRNKLDQNALANAKLNTIEKDLKLKGTQFNTAVSILYVGYLFMQIPSNMLLSSRRVRPSIYMSVCMMVWAVVAAVTAAIHNYTGLVIVRFFLG